MAKTTKTDANWTTVDVATLPTDLAKAHAAYKASYTAMKDARNVFEDVMSDAIAPPAGKRVVFGYNFGKLSVAIVDDDRKATKPATGTQSLADWIATQRAANRSV